MLVDSGNPGHLVVEKELTDQDMCLVWNLNLVRASYLMSDLGKTKAFAMLMKVLVEQIRERSLPAKKGH